MALLTLDEARAAIQVDDADTSIDEDTLQGLIDSVASIFAEYKGEVIDETEVVERYWLTGGRFPLRQVPVSAVTDLTTVDGLTVWDVDTFLVDSESGIVEWGGVTGTTLYGHVQVTYTAGYATPPARYKEAAKLAVRDLWAVYRGVGTQDSEAESFDPDVVLNRRTRMLLGPPRPSVA